MSAAHVPPVDLLFDMQAGKRLPYCHNAHAQSVKCQSKSMFITTNLAIILMCCTPKAFYLYIFLLKIIKAQQDSYRDRWGHNGSGRGNDRRDTCYHPRTVFRKLPQSFRTKRQTSGYKTGTTPSATDSISYSLPVPDTIEVCSSIWATKSSKGICIQIYITNSIDLMCQALSGEYNGRQYTEEAYAVQRRTPSIL